MLVSILSQIQSQEQPDLVVVELGGLVGPGLMRDYITGASHLEIESMTVILVVDVCAPERLHQALDYLFEMMVLDSDVVVLNRAERCPEDELAAFGTWLREVKQDVTIIPLRRGKVDVSSWLYRPDVFKARSERRVDSPRRSDRFG